MLILCLLLGCQMPGIDDNGTAVEDPDNAPSNPDDTHTPDSPPPPSGTEDDPSSMPDYTITFPEKPGISGTAQPPTEMQSELITRILANSIGNSAYGGNASLVLDAAEEYAKENPSKDRNDRLREVSDYMYRDVCISGWFTIPEGSFDTPADIGPCDLDFSISSEAGKSRGRIAMGIEQKTLIFAEDVVNYIPQGEGCVSRISEGFVYLNMDPTSLHVIIAAGFEDNGKPHSIYYEQKSNPSDQESGEFGGDSLCILDEANIDYVLFGFDTGAPMPEMPLGIARK